MQNYGLQKRYKEESAMADSSARRVEFETNRKTETEKAQQVGLDGRQVRWTGLEKTLLILGSIVTLTMMIFLVSSSISATSAQHELTANQQSVTRQENKITDLRQEIGELTSSSRLNKVAREKGLTLIEKNIRTIR
ncbi:cell division protein ftsl [Lactobacillus intestinalis DSM 6629]|uniref:Cell division protein FtsL n=2 Tax=Lactobacillus intestinalis TaxID=151781 RepID=A0ABR5PSF5_9LACO|nr:cell division protein ftsl [Lactobacillus intestinalis DSM 6629]